MFCAISGEVPTDPVISTKSGHLFERRLIEKYITEHGSCPITSQPLTKQDLLTVQPANIVKTRPPNATSIPSLLSFLNSEWDALMLETFALKKQLESVRQELSNALFQHDAACRVIARLVKERDAARAGYTNNVQQPQTSSSQPESMQLDAKKLSPEIVDEMVKTAADLSKGRKKRPVAEDHPSSSSISEYKELESVKFSGKESFETLDIHPSNGNVLTGGSDKHVKLYHSGGKKAISSVVAHGDKVNQVQFHPTSPLAFSCSADNTVCILDCSQDKLAVKSHIETHTGSVNGISLHATGKYLASASSDKTWSFIDIEQSTVLTQVTSNIDDNDKNGINCIKFHPDGLILGAGSGSVVRIWDAKTQENVMTFSGHTQDISTITFSENGYHLATAGKDGQVKLWDLRKLENVFTIDMGPNSKINALDFDYSGQYLGIAGSELRIILAKQWTELYKNAGVEEMYSFKFSRNARYLVAACADNSLKYYGLDM